jgi:hypothetical protein
MDWKRKSGGGLLALIGFLLSPLSWWNDLFVNFPLALGFAWLVALINKAAFEPGLIVGYWLTNVAGLILMHHGLSRMVTQSRPRYSWRALSRDILICLLYTALIMALVQFKVLRPMERYFP